MSERDDEIDRGTESGAEAGTESGSEPGAESETGTFADGFAVIPAVDVQDGEVVQLVQGERGTGKRYGDPVAAAERWIDEGAEALHLVDLDGAFEGERVNAPAFEAIVDAVGDEVDLQLGGGIRTAADARSLLDLGIDRVILGTAAVENPPIVETIAETHPGTVVVSLDAKDGEVVVSGWTESTGLDPAAAAARYESLGAGAILFTNVDVEGQLEGIDRAAVEAVVDAVDVPVIASGGVASLDDVVALREAGAAAVVIGTALYEGTFTLREAQRAAAGGGAK
ncbi:1-(5-phosphoribosyl)-5-[(5-phosphoribosylamino)methylideneamino]imidazole-4-carboxamide isomerase [haloarchaeon 3A1-DGR]|nr:1-(5-phosphoribosyl)-5-[(5-phosphoribosylamino)methylideneamino]imidazole-4-carboxamide isomerase [haloarchaeon 3A1-DGR]